MKYLELCYGPPRHSGMIADDDSFMKAIRSSEVDNVEVYRSMWRFGQAGAEHVVEHGSLSGFGGLLGADRIMWDIDGLDTALDDLHALLQRLWSLDVERRHVRVWFSGGKGFHVCLPPAYGDMAMMLPDMPQTMKDFCTTIYENVDPAIYTQTSLIRANWTKHRGGKYKIPLALEEIEVMSMDEILELASAHPRDTRKVIEGDEYEALKQGEKVPVLYERSQTFEQRKKKEIKKYSLDTLPRHYTCCTRMLEAGPQPGSRRPTMQRIVRMLRRRNMGVKTTRVILTEWLSRSDIPMDEVKRNVETTLKSAYEGGHGPYRCDDNIMSHYCHFACQYYATRRGLKEDNMDMMAVELKQVYDAGILECFNMSSVWTQATYNFEPAETALLFGPTKIGKTSFVHNLFMGLPDKKILNVHLEMARMQEIARLLQVAHNKRVNASKGVDEVRDMLRSLDPGSPEWENFMAPIRHIVPFSQRDINAIKEKIDEVKPDIVLLDSFDLVETNRKNQHIVDKQKEVFYSLKEQTDSMGHVMLILHHVKKGSLNEDMSMEDMSGWAGLYQQPAHVIAIEGKHGANRIHVVSKATRRFQELDLYLTGNPETFTFHEEI